MMSNHNSSNGSPTPVLVTYGWPRERYANGVVSYTAEITEGMRRMGAEPRVAVYKLDSGSGGSFVSRVPEWRESCGSANRLAYAVIGRVFPQFAHSRMRGSPLLAEIKRLKNDVGINICEIEEAHGTPNYLIRNGPMPVVVRLHGPWFLNGTALGVEQNKAFWKRVQSEGKCIAAADGVTAPSQSVLDAVRSHYGLPLRTAEVIPNPVRPAENPLRWNARACEPDRVLFVGRFDRHKGGDVVIDAMARLRGDRPHCRLTFVGPDSGLANADGSRTSLREYIESRMPGAIEAGSIQWLGLQPPERIAELRQRAMATVVASRYENFPMAALEAMSHGCPLVGTAVGGIPEIIQHERNGLLCKPGDAVDLAEKIRAMLGNPEFAARLGAQAAIDTEARYHPDKIAQQTLAFYRRVIDSSKLAKRNGRLA